MCAFYVRCNVQEKRGHSIEVGRRKLLLLLFWIHNIKKAQSKSCNEKRKSQKDTEKKIKKKKKETKYRQRISGDGWSHCP